MELYSKNYKLAGSKILLLLFVSLNSLRRGDGLATKYSYFEDKACEVDSGHFMLIFGVPAPFNECYWQSDYDSLLPICDIATGETGFQRFGDGNCTELESDDVEAPSCELLDSSSDEYCGEVGGTCASTVACTDDVPSAISSTVVNFIATEYNDEDCSDPTGNTEVVSGRYAIFGAHTGECTQFWHFSDYSISECLEDGSTISQHFSSDDITCSGDVRREIYMPLFFPPPCSTVPVDGLYYSLGSCTTDAATLTLYTPAPTAVASYVDSAHAEYTPAPTSDANDYTAAGSLAPAANADHGAAAETLAPTTEAVGFTSSDVSAPTVGYDDDHAQAYTPAPVTDTGVNATMSTPAPTSGFDHDEANDHTPSPSAEETLGISVTPSPSAEGIRSISDTLAPIDVSGGGEDDEATPPVGIDEAALASGAIRSGRGSAVWGVVLYTVVELLVAIAA